MNSLKSDPAQNTLVNHWIDELPKKIQEKWGKESLEKIRLLLTSPDILWSFLTPIDFARLTLSVASVADLKQELWLETVKILVIDCIRAHKRDLEPKQESTNDGTLTNSAD